MSNFLGRLAERASGPPAAGLSPRLAPVFPIGRPMRPEAEPEPFRAETSSAIPATPDARPLPAPTPEITLPPSRAGRELREIQIERPMREPRTPDAPTEAPAGEPPRTELPTHERTLERSTVRREVEPAQPAQAPALAAARIAHVPVPAASRNRAPQQQAPRIEVRIGRVEVRRAPAPEPVEWQAPPAADPPAATGFGELAASRRYVDRRWS